MSLATVCRFAVLAAWVVLIVAYAGMISRPRRSEFLTQRHSLRLALFGIEAAALIGWAVARWELHWDAPLFGPRGLGVIGDTVFGGAPGQLAPVQQVLHVTSAIVVWLGVVWAVWAERTLGRWFSGTFGVRVGHELVMWGPYAFTRHPIYTGLVLALLATAWQFNSRAGLLATAVITVSFLFHTLIEERLFVAHFGDAYRAYQARVPRLIPWRGRAELPPS